jgi:guanylate kinase
MKAGKIFLILAPLGVGKEELLEKLGQKLKFWRIKEITTLVPETKIEKKHYSSVSWGEFKTLVEKEQLAVSVQRDGHYFGVTNKELNQALDSGLPIIWDIYYGEGARIKNEFPSVFSILITSSLKDIRERLSRRGLISENLLNSTLMKSKEEIDKALTVADYILVNKEEDKEKSFLEFLDVMEARL